MTPSPISNTHTLLRRTAAALAAIASLVFAGSAAALTMSLPGGIVCTTPSISTQPDGSLALNCASTTGTTTTTTDPAGAFSVTVPSSTITGPASGAGPLINVTSFTVVRTGGTTGDVTMTYTISGTACWTGAAQLTVLSGTTSSAAIGLTITGAGTCTVTISNLTAGVLGTPASATINVTSPTQPISTGGGAVPSIPGCTPDATTQMGTLPTINTTGFNLIMPSGSVTSFPLPAVPSAYPQGESVAFGETPTANSPSVYTMDVSIGPCPGVFNQSTNLSPDYCDWNNYAQQNGGTFSWSSNATYAPMQGWCYATDSTTGPQQYFNVRYHYTSCRNGAPSCGFSLSTN